MIWANDARELARSRDAERVPMADALMAARQALEGDTVVLPRARELSVDEERQEAEIRLFTAMWEGSAHDRDMLTSSVRVYALGGPD